MDPIGEEPAEQDSAEFMRQLNEAREREAASGGASISEMAEAEDDVEDEGTLFPMGFLKGDEVTPARMIKKGLPVEVTVSIGKAEVPMPDSGLLDPERQGRVLVTYVFGSNQEIPVREEDKIVRWKIRQNLRAVHVASANDEVALITSEFDALLALDQAAAGALLDQLGAMFRSANADTAVAV